MKIEEANLKDAEQILELQKLAYQSEAEIHNDFTIQPLTQTLDEIVEEFKSNTVLKICDDSRVIGSVRASLKDDTCYVSKLIVHPLYQNRGMGTQLMNAIEGRFAEARRYELFTGFKSEKNIHLYEKLSYKVFDMKRINKNLSLLFFEKVNE